MTRPPSSMLWNINRPLWSGGPPLQQKPAGLAPEYAAQFQDRSVADAYHHRPPYPDEVFAILTGLITCEPRAVLDAGCGTGDIARRLAPLVARVDAVDFSPAM